MLITERRTLLKTHAEAPGLQEISRVGGGPGLLLSSQSHNSVRDLQH